MAVEGWDEIRTALYVARLGTVSGAAEALGVHHATVIRHIDALEKRLGARLFQRHARGYTPTEAGQDLLLVAQATDEQFTQLASRIRGRGEAVGGELIVTSLPILSPRLTPVIAAFQAAHPGILVRYLTGERLFRLEYGEAHVALRAGPAPEEPDNVVQPLTTLAVGLFASRAYAAAQGLPEGPQDLPGHRFVGQDGPARAPFLRWLDDRVAPERIVWRATDHRSMQDAVRAGVGLGFLPRPEGLADPDLVEAFAPLPEWAATLWLVTHVDLHRSVKVQAFLHHLKAETRGWGTE